MAEVALYGGAFDPPHNGHVAVAHAARERFAVPLLVLVSEAPAHRSVESPADLRLELARAAFPGDEVRLDPYPRTIDLLRGERFDDPLLVIGADQFADFLAWKDPGAVLELAHLAVATRPGYPQEVLDAVLLDLERPERVAFFEIEPNAVASREVRALAAVGKPVGGLVPAAVARLIEERGLYRED